MNLIVLKRRENVSGRENKSQFRGLLELRNIGNDLFSKAMILINWGVKLICVKNQVIYLVFTFTSSTLVVGACCLSCKASSSNSERKVSLSTLDGGIQNSNPLVNTSVSVSVKNKLDKLAICLVGFKETDPFIFICRFATTCIMLRNYECKKKMFRFAFIFSLPFSQALVGFFGHVRFIHENKVYSLEFHYFFLTASNSPSSIYKGLR